MKFSKDRILQLSVIGFAALVSGIVARLIIVDVYHKDNTTANWTMFAVIAGFILLYFLFMEIYTPLAARITRKKSKDVIKEMPVEEKRNEQVLKADPVPEQKSAEITPPPLPAAKIPTVTDLKIESFGKYCDEVMKDYVSADNLERLKAYIGYYARKQNNPITHKILTQEVDTYDLLHFGWNMWNHFKETTQPEVARWLKAVFAELKDIDLSTIEHNLKHKERGGKYLIKIRERID